MVKNKIGRKSNIKVTQKSIKHDHEWVNQLETISGWLIVATLVIIPLLVRLHIELFIAPKITFLNTGIGTDLYTFYKWKALIISTVILIFLFGIRICLSADTIRSTYINIPLLLLTGFVLLSLLTAEYKGIAWKGMYNQHEGTVTMLCYLALFFTVVHTAFKEKILQTIFWGLGTFIGINTMLGVIAFFGHDPFDISFINHLIVPVGAAGAANGVFNATVNNPNYVSGIAASIAIAFYVMALLSENKKLWIWSINFSLLGFAMCIAALSTSGFMVLYILLPIVLVAALLLGNPKRVLGTSLIIILFWSVLFIGMGLYQPQVWKEADVLGILRPVADVNTASIGNVSDHEDEWPGKEFGLPKPGISPGNGRLYIWKETAKLIEQSPILGYGADTIAYYFPQSDINKVANVADYSNVVTKAHCFYLNFAFNYGIPALLALLVLFFLHFVKTIKFIITHKDSEITPIILALFVFWLGFLLQWLVNDSVIGTSVVFWVLFGMAVSLMRQAEEAEAKPVVSRGRRVKGTVLVSHDWTKKAGRPGPDS